MARITGSGAILVLLAVLPGVTGCHLTTGWYRDTRQFKEALELQRTGQSQQALAVYRAISQNRRYVGALNNMAVIHAMEGDLKLAEGLLTEAAEIEPDLVTLWANLGVVRYLRGQREMAVEALREVVPARRRMLDRAVSAGRVPWRYDDLKAKTRRSMRIAREYLEKLGVDEHAAPDKQAPMWGHITRDMVLL
jgi:tetratricopeptide (TPR) repeat protein